MRNFMNGISVTCFLVLIFLATGLTGCASKVAPVPKTELVSCPSCGDKPPGMVEYVWEEPMTDVIDVPAGLDPEGIYYRPAHQEVVEIRQGRWKYYKQQD